MNTDYNWARLYEKRFDWVMSAKRELLEQLELLNENSPLSSTVSNNNSYISVYGR